MDMKLVVVRPFAGHARGDAITDPETVRRVLAGEQAACVVRVPTEPQEK
jgi:hypothetical protein